MIIIKKTLIEIIKSDTYFKIVMYKENGKELHLKEHSDSDTRVIRYWITEQKNIRNRLAPEKLGKYKNCKIHSDESDTLKF